MKENDRKWKKKKENEIKWKNERTCNKMTEKERKWKKMKKQWRKKRKNEAKCSARPSFQPNNRSQRSLTLSLSTISVSWPCTCPRFTPENGKGNGKDKGKDKDEDKDKKNDTPEGKKNQRFQFFLFLNSCTLISFCVAQFVTIRMNPSGL